ncbi:hypothetical protein LJR289_002284 [Pseudoduganella sp. LjRoot289]|uniref:hypothetical protein n=1 Tax=Pseudoduganella sp. LjRoot289 TaxID=3342314 RepID=UPI003ECFEF70
MREHRRPVPAAPRPDGSAIAHPRRGGRAAGRSGRAARASGVAGAAALAALLLAALPATLAAQPLGRLFNTPQQRAILDARRDGSALDSQPPPPATYAEPRPEPLQLSGVVQRSNGKSTVWVNQAPVPDSEGQVLKDRSVSLRLPSGRRITLKPGQSYDEVTGTIGNADE